MQIYYLVLILLISLPKQGRCGILLPASELTLTKTSDTIQEAGVLGRERRYICKDGDVLFYITAKNEVMAKEVSSKKVVWGKSFEGQDLTSIYIASNVLIVTSDNNLLFGLNRRTGEILWEYGKQVPIDIRHGFKISPKVVISSNTAYIVYDNSVLNIRAESEVRYEAAVLHISLPDGKELWRKIVTGFMPAGIELTSDLRYLAVIMRDSFNPKTFKETGIDTTSSGRLYLINSIDGKVVGDWTSSGETRLWNEKVVSKYLIVGGGIGNLFIFTPPDLKSFHGLELFRDDEAESVSYPNIRICSDGKALALWNADPPGREETFSTAPVQIRRIPDGELLKVYNTPPDSSKVIEVICDPAVVRIVHSRGITSWLRDGSTHALRKNLITYVVEIQKDNAIVITDAGMKQIRLSPDRKNNSKKQ